MHDWNTVGDEAITMLQEYIRIKTINPPGDEILGAEWLGSQLTKEGIDYQIIAPKDKPSRASVIARIKGNGSKRPLLLLNHIDVVSVNEKEWTVAPFAGEIIDDYLYGRGTLDMKGMAIVELIAFCLLNREKAKLDRDIIFLCVADEETGGEYGAKFLIENHWDLVACEYAIGEIGFGMQHYQRKNETVFLVQTGEKGLAQFKMYSYGKSGHASIPAEDNPVEALIIALGKIMQAPLRKEYMPTVKRFFWEIAKHDGLDVSEDYLSIDATTIDHIIQTSLLRKRSSLFASLQDTLAVTVLKAGVQENVIPSEAEAWVDCRILPGMMPEEFIDMVTSQARLDNPKLVIKPYHTFPANESPIDTELFDAVKGTIHQHYPNHLVLPTYFPGATDLRHFRTKGVIGYGIEPFIIDGTEMERVHGKDERISLANIRNGVRIMYDMVKAIAG